MHQSDLASEVSEQITSAGLLTKLVADDTYMSAAQRISLLNQRAANFIGFLNRAKREHPPGVTLGAETSSPTTTGATAWVNGDAFISTNGKASPNIRPGSVIEPTVSGYAHFVKAGGITGSSTGGSTYTLDFDYDGMAFDIGMSMAYQSLTWLEIWVDGYLCASYPGTTATDGHNGFFQVVFPDARRRNIRIVRGNNWTCWLIPDSSGKFYYPSTPAIGPYMIIAGDSFTEGTGATATKTAGYVDLLPIMLGWNGIEGSGLGGTGYINVPAGSGKTNLQARIATDIVPKAPDICMIAMGYNDVDGINTTAQIVAAAEATWAQATAAGIALIVVGPWDSPPLANSQQRTLLQQTDAALKAAALSQGVQYLSPWDETWMGGNTAYLFTDSVHPNDLGHKRIASMLAAHLA
ncbi:SGNH/GDSL hydrolase family protein [Gordonia sp. N1V]|uniref:SGNH/GDSL hydrolase family protein n=1 Tax=Gordonia sp. N1V TaxID=3034163 RepID=UPI0023E0D7FC|nr:SGNH/GDSL hydrolase family protein [Gordonia sp. N1V]MDF3280932.1 SGNH/GDSL hydrolase family protein [Gordonia sp. N1V]